jgi:hypothetical protein
MATPKFLMRQAATCATMAKQTHDEESRQRCLWLEQIYLHLAESEEFAVGEMSAITVESEKKPAA